MRVKTEKQLPLNVMETLVVQKQRHFSQLEIQQNGTKLDNNK